MARLLHIAALQTRPRRDFDEALQEALNLAEQAVAGGATLLLLPEYCGGLRTEGRALVPPAEPDHTHPVLLGLRRFARQHTVCVVVGSLAIPGEQGRIVNRGFVISSDGGIAARYDKLHLFDVALSPGQIYQESLKVSGGNQAILVDVLGARLGLSICYDLRFPQLYRDLAQAGAEILLVPAAFTQRTGEAHWHVLNRARAIENGAWVVSPCATGPVPGGGASYGHSLIVDPWGAVVADAGESHGVISAQIDLDEVARVRQQIPSLEHDRPYTLKHIKEGSRS